MEEIITITYRTICSLRRTITCRTVIHRTVTALVRIVIHTMGGTIPGLGTATVRMDIRTIGDQSIETNRLDRALDGGIYCA